MSAVVGTNGVPPVTVTRSQTAPPGACQTFTCHYNVPQNAQRMRVTWLKYISQEKQSSLWTAGVDDSQSFSISQSRSGISRVRGSQASLSSIMRNHSISFFGIKEEDYGLYICRVSYKLHDRNVNYENLSTFNFTKQGGCNSVTAAVSVIHNKLVF